MNIETDQVEILSGVRAGQTTGSPIAFTIQNRDWENWQEIMAVENASLQGNGWSEDHVLGMLICREPSNIIMQICAMSWKGPVPGKPLRGWRRGHFSANYWHVSTSTYIARLCPLVSEGGPAGGQPPELAGFPNPGRSVAGTWLVNHDAEAQMIAAIDQARQDGESLGGSFEVGALGVPPGLGTFTCGEGRLDARLCGLLMSIPAIKAVEIGEGINNAGLPGSQVHDEIHYREDRGIYRLTNHAGGIEGGMSNGETIWARAYMKPIPTLYKPLVSVNTEMWVEQKADIERSDICAVPAASVVGEAMLAYGLAAAFLDKFSGDFMEQIQEAYARYGEYLRKVWKWEKI